MRLAKLASLALVIALGACEKSNSRYCDANHPCASGFACDEIARQCNPADAGVVDLGGDLPAVDLAFDQGSCAACGGMTPICAGATCVACSSDPQCSSQFPMTPYCLPTGECAQCRPSMNDCTTAAQPICDPNSHACRGCRANSECASQVCEGFDESAPGSCVDPGSVLYVGTSNCSDNPNNTGTTPQAPFCTINHALTKVTATRNLIKIEAGSYAEDVKITNNAIVTIVGDPGQTSIQAASSSPFSVTGTGAKVTLIGLTFTGGMNGGSGIACAGPMSLTVLRCSLDSNEGAGIDVSTKTGAITIDASLIQRNAGGGIKVGDNNDTTGYTITNNFITDNGDTTASDFGGVILNDKTSPAPNPAKLAGNTIANNKSKNAYAGVACTNLPVLSIVDDILFNNVDTIAASETNCTTTFTATDDSIDAARLGASNQLLSSSPFMSASDYHLASTAMMCIGTGTDVGLTFDIDGDPRPSPGTSRVDIGADQFK